MKRLLNVYVIFLVAIFTSLTGCEDSSIVQHNAPPSNDQIVSSESVSSLLMENDTTNIIPGEYIVVFKDQGEGIGKMQAAEQATQTVQSLRSEYAIAKDSLLSQYQFALKGFAAKLTPMQLKKLKQDPRVDHISPNKLFYLNIPKGSLNNMATHERTSQTSSQTVPWGVERVGGPLDGIGKTAWIIDTGIDQDHNDLNVDTQNSVSFIAGETADDYIGHGTHVAGIIAAINNSIDVVGVAAGATVVAVKVCSYFTDLYGRRFVACPKNSILDGVDYVDNYASSNDIINMSLGGQEDPDLDNAVIDAANSGLKFTIAAGNAADDAENYSPARANHANVYTVSAFRQGDQFVQTFDWNTPNCNSGQDPNVGSNYSTPPVDYAAPGESILSLWRNGGRYTTCGTSMAAPHLAGLLLAAPYGIATDGTVSNDPDGNADPIAVAGSGFYAPTITGSVVNNHPRLDWNAVPEAVEYNIYRKFEASGNWGLWTTVMSNSYVDQITSDPDLSVIPNLPNGPDNWIAYKVRSVDVTDNESGASNTVYFDLGDGGIVPHSLDTEKSENH